jgi:hypothetical protein
MRETKLEMRHPNNHLLLALPDMDYFLAKITEGRLISNLLAVPGRL